MRGGGVNTTTNQQTRDEGGNKEGNEGKGNGKGMALAATDSRAVTAMERQLSGGVVAAVG